MSATASPVPTTHTFKNEWMTGGYNPIIVTTLLLWDILITFPREKLYIWSYHSRASWTTLLYIITRYLPFIVSAVGVYLKLKLEGQLISVLRGVSENPGLVAKIRSLDILYTIPWFIVLGCTEILFMRRVVALYDGSTLLSRLLIGLFICEMVAVFVPFSFRAFSNSGTKPTGLWPVASSSFAIPELVFQTILVALVMKKAISDWWSVKAANKSLTSIIIRDGLWGYFCNLCGLLVIFIRAMWLTGPLRQSNILVSYASFSVTSTRLILNLRSAAAEQSEDNITSTVGSRLTFFQGLRSFFAPGNNEFSAPYRFPDVGYDSDSYDYEQVPSS